MNIYVGNLPATATEDTVRALFAEHGQVNEVNVIKDRFTGEPRGFAFVEMPTKSEAIKAMSSVDGVEIDERSLIVNEARPSRPQKRGGRSRNW